MEVLNFNDNIKMNTLEPFVARLKELRKIKFSSAQKLEDEIRKILPKNCFFPAKMISLWESGQRKYSSARLVPFVTAIDEVLEANGKLLELYLNPPVIQEIINEASTLNVLAIVDIGSLIPREFREHKKICKLVQSLATFFEDMKISTDPDDTNVKEFVTSALKLIIKE